MDKGGGKPYPKNVDKNTFFFKPLPKIMRQHKEKIHYICKVCDNNRKVLTFHFSSSHMVDENNVKFSLDGCTRITSEQKINRPGVAGAVLQTGLSFIN